MERPDIFSVPRRFDIATVLVAMTGFALLFALMLLLEPAIQMGQLGMGLVAGVFAAVAVGQALAVKQGNPRTASIIAGGVYWLIAPILAKALAGDEVVRTTSSIDVCLYAAGIVFGPVTGYLAGTLVGGVFLIAYHLREGGLLKKHLPAPDSNESSPWDDSINEPGVELSGDRR